MKMLIILALIAAVVIEAAVILRITNRNKKLSEKIEDSQNNGSLMAEVYQTRAQIASLQSQINPHFLYNTLESIRSKAILHDENEIAEMIETLARLFRYNIGRSEQLSTIADELENVQNYVKIQNYRFRNKFQLIEQLDVLGERIETYPLPMLTLQPLVENAVHHGLENRLDVGTVTIGCELTERYLILKIEDNGKGMSVDQLADLRYKIQHAENIPKMDSLKKKGAGIALANVNHRLKLFYGEEYGMDVFSAQDVGTTLILMLPKNGHVREEALQ